MVEGMVMNENDSVLNLTCILFISGNVGPRVTFILNYTTNRVSVFMYAYVHVWESACECMCVFEFVCVCVFEFVCVCVCVCV